MTPTCLAAILGLLWSSNMLLATHAKYRVGVGIGDTTGPAVGVGMMGYAKGGQTTGGIHTRLYARAFYFEDPSTNAVVFVSVDSGMIGQMLKHEIIQRLKRWPGGLELRPNQILLSATHTHSGPSGYLQYVIYSLGGGSGFVRQTFQALVQGITVAIQRAHKSLQPARLFLAESELHDANVNRSPSSYERNPYEERAKYDSNTDKSFTQLNIVSDETNQILGIINWFAVHATSMNNSNHLISGDNKGLASLILESEINSSPYLGKGPFVAAFASSNLGDVSPNLKGPRCNGNGLPCDLGGAQCCPDRQACFAFGPGSNMFHSTEIIARRQVTEAKSLLEDRTFEIVGAISSALQWIDMTKQRVKLSDGNTILTCEPALGTQFASGTTDGPGDPAFTKCLDASNGAVSKLVSMAAHPSLKQKWCHHPKDILLNTGKLNKIGNFHPILVDTQILKIGPLVIVGVPGEITTMAGRRLRERLIHAGNALGSPEALKVALAGLSNVYTHYITTKEEYQNQRYEGASTIYGPHTLQAYEQQYDYLIRKLAKGEKVRYGKPPPYRTSKQLSLDSSLVLDLIPPSKKAGECTSQVPSTFASPGQTIKARFVSGHPRHNLMLENTYLKVEHLLEDWTWEVVATDANLSTKFVWVKRCSACAGEAIIYWDIPAQTPEGVYKISHLGHSNSILNRKPLAFEGGCPEFKVVHGRRSDLAVQPELAEATGWFGSSAIAAGMFQAQTTIGKSIALLGHMFRN